MSYNITNWRTDKLDNLEIPISALQFSDELQSRGFCVKRHELTALNSLAFSFGEGSIIRGIANEKTDMLQVAEIRSRGVASGYYWNYILLPALEQSTGQLEALIVWEEGDYICKFEVHDGFVTETPT